MTSLRSTAILAAVTAMSLGAAAFNASVDAVMARTGSSYEVHDPMHSLIDEWTVAALGSTPIETFARSAPSEQPLTPTR